MLDWAYLCCQRDGAGWGERTAALGSRLQCYFVTVLPVVPIARLHPLPSLPPSACPAGPEAGPV